MDPATDDERLTVMGLLAETWTGLVALTSAQLAEHGLDGVEFEVLLRLFRSPAGRLRMTDLAAQTSLTSSGITRLVDRLVQAGSLQRQACTSDRRATYAVITDAGRHRLGAALPGHLELLERWLVGPLSPEALAGFVGTLRVLRDGLRPAPWPAWSGQPARRTRRSRRISRISRTCRACRANRIQERTGRIVAARR